MIKIPNDEFISPWILSFEKIKTKIIILVIKSSKSEI